MPPAAVHQRSSSPAAPRPERGRANQPTNQRTERGRREASPIRSPFSFPASLGSARAIPPPRLELRPAHGPLSSRGSHRVATSGKRGRHQVPCRALGQMDTNAGSFVAVRRLAGSDRAAGAVAFHHSSSAEVVTGSTAWIGRGLSCVCAQGRDSDARLSFDLTPVQEECLLRLQNRIEVQYDSSNREHQEELKALWCASFPGIELQGLISEQWKEMGWQGKDPSTDFRGGGFISLENLLFFARNYPKSFQELLRKQNGDRAIWEYPFAVAGVNITFMLIQMLDLQAVKPRSLFGAVFLKLLSENDRAFDIIYCITFKVMDQQWLDMHATYMDFNTVMKATRRQLERELLLEDILRIEDMPSYKLLAR